MKVNASIDLDDFLDEHLSAWDVVESLKDAIKKQAVKELKESPEYRRMVEAAKKAMLDRISK
jgi:hypothetical protein